MFESDLFEVGLFLDHSWLSPQVFEERWQIPVNVTLSLGLTNVCRLGSLRRPPEVQLPRSHHFQSAGADGLRCPPGPAGSLVYVTAPAVGTGFLPVGFVGVV